MVVWWWQCKNPQNRVYALVFVGGGDLENQWWWDDGVGKQTPIQVERMGSVFNDGEW